MSSKRFKKLTDDSNKKGDIFSKLISEIKKNCTVKFDESIDLINEDSFDKDVTALATSGGDIIGLENFKNYYNNYLTGFSDAEFTIVDIFGQGDKMVKHWNFKGTHDGDFFGVPATGKSVDISGTTLIKMKDGKIAAEQDYMDFLSFYTQLGLLGQ